MPIFNLFKICNEITVNKKRELFVIIFLSIVIPLLEVINLSLFLPIFETLVDSGSVSNYSNYVKNFFSIVGINFSLKNLLIFVGVFLLLKIIINILYLKLFNKYIEDIRIDWTSNIVEKILLGDNKSSNIKNHAEKTNTILLETRKAQSGIKQYIQIVSQFINLIFTISILFLISMKLTLFTMGLFFIVLLVFSKFISKYSMNVGNERRRLDNLFADKINYIMSGFKQIRIFNIQNKILNDYKNNINYYGKIYGNFRFISQLSRPFLEFLILIIFTLIILYSVIVQKTELEVILPIIGTFLIVSSRFANSLQACISSYISLLGNSASLANIKKNLSNLNSLREKINNSLLYQISDFEKKIEVKNVQFKYGNIEIFKNLNIEILKNDKIEIKSPSGRGKSTLLDLIMGLIQPNSGYILIDGKKMSQINYSKIFGYVTQETFLYKDTIENNIIMYRENVSKDQIDKIINICCLDKMINNLENKLQYVLDEGGLNLSGGQRQRIGIARALISNPKILILDEATNSLDKKLEIEIFQNINTYFKDITIISVTHESKSLWSHKIIELDENN
jgi:ABC-type multidrug transport system fused ATPase/permease subunit